MNIQFEINYCHWDALRIEAFVADGTAPAFSLDTTAITSVATPPQKLFDGCMIESIYEAPSVVGGMPSILVGLSGPAVDSVNVTADVASTAEASVVVACGRDDEHYSACALSALLGQDDKRYLLGRSVSCTSAVEVPRVPLSEVSAISQHDFPIK